MRGESAPLLSCDRSRDSEHFLEVTHCGTAMCRHPYAARQDPQAPHTAQSFHEYHLLLFFAIQILKNGLIIWQFVLKDWHTETWERISLAKATLDYLLIVPGYVHTISAESFQERLWPTEPKISTFWPIAGSIAKSNFDIWSHCR